MSRSSTKPTKSQPHPGKTQISLHIHAVSSVFAACMKKLWVLANHRVPSGDLSDCMAAQAELNCRRRTCEFIGFLVLCLKYIYKTSSITIIFPSYYFTINSSHAVRGLSRVRQYPPWLLFATFVEFVGYSRYNPQKTRKQ